MKANISNRWSDEAKELVREHDFKLDTVYDAAGTDKHSKCEFCGSNLRYVAVIEATLDPSVNRRVGLDCLERTLGRGWTHYKAAKRGISKLKKAASIKNRAERNRRDKADIIEWLNVLPEERMNPFFRDMKRILETGSRPFSEKMEAALRKNMADPKYDREAANQRRLEFQPILMKIERVRDLVMETDRVRPDDRGGWIIEDPSSAFEFVNSVYEYATKNLKASEKQLEALNKVYVRYRDAFLTKRNTVEDYSDIPF